MRPRAGQRNSGRPSSDATAFASFAGGMEAVAVVSTLRALGVSFGVSATTGLLRASAILDLASDASGADGPRAIRSVLTARAGVVAAMRGSALTSVFSGSLGYRLRLFDRLRFHRFGFGLAHRLRLFHRLGVLSTFPTSTPITSIRRRWRRSTRTSRSSSPTFAASAFATASPKSAFATSPRSTSAATFSVTARDCASSWFHPIARGTTAPSSCAMARPRC